jgi:hypothetical protein
VYEDALERGYNFDRNKIPENITPSTINVTRGQIEYEVTHLCNKLKKRDFNRYEKLTNLTNFEQHPLFKVIDGPVEEWEIIL